MARRIVQSMLGPALLLAVAVLPGCAFMSAPETPTTRFFLLTSDAERGSATTRTALPDLALGVGPFSFPTYLDRPQMVRRSGTNQIEFSQFNRWAEPVNRGFQRILAEDLGDTLGTSRIVLFPWYEMRLDLQVKGEVLRFESTGDGHVVIECIWTLYHPGDDTYLVTRHESLERDIDSDRPEEIAAGLSALIGDLSERIAEALREARGRRRG